MPPLPLPSCQFLPGGTGGEAAWKQEEETNGWLPESALLRIAALYENLIGKLWELC
jgi:hypothetical protein